MEGVKKNYLDYLTEQDVIKRYAERRNIPVDEIEDLYNALRKWMVLKLNDTSKSTKVGFIMPNFCTFLHKNLVLEDLKKSVKNEKYRRAEEQLIRYLHGHQGIKFK